ncbi:unnamed protein product [Amoebophrya sp. A120]|nr:unnamed protein product [Amoebophrya sp. A120]|eukprot:GSA120T00005097001.1
MFGRSLPCRATGAVGRMRVPFRNVRQRRRTRGRIIQLKQTHYEPKPDCSEKLPVSILGTSVVKRLVQSPRQEAEELLQQIDWDKYKTGVPGVRWHAAGGFVVRFAKYRPDKNFNCVCTCLFRVGLYGFEEAKRRAIAYRKRLEQEWNEQQKIWRILDTKEEIRKFQAAKQKLEATTKNAREEHVVTHDISRGPPPGRRGDERISPQERPHQPLKRMSAEL